MQRALWLAAIASSSALEDTHETLCRVLLLPRMPRRARDGCCFPSYENHRREDRLCPQHGGISAEASPAR